MNFMSNSSATSAERAAFPLLKAGIITDTHINETAAGCRKLKGALKLFAAQEVDLMIHCGDIAEVYNPEAYKLYRKMINTLFQQKKPEEIFISAYHDWTTPQEADVSFQGMKEALEIPHNMLDKKIFKGYTFLIIPQNVPMEELEHQITTALAENPGKPLFVIDHIPPYGIFHNTKLWGSVPRLEVLKKFPSVIHISGHSHGSLLNESNIWQKEFTAVNTGCLSTWGGDFAGTAPKSKKVSEAIVMELFPEKILFRRFSVVTGREYAPHTPWCVPLPFDPETAPYSPDRRYKDSPEPVFSPKARLKTVYDKNAPEFLTLRFPGAAPDVFKYRIVIAQKNQAGVFKDIALTEVAGNFYKAASYRKKVLELCLSKAYFESRKTYRFSVVPENFFGKEGSPLTAEWTAPVLLASEILFESVKPMNELPFLTELNEGVPVKKEGSFYCHDTYNARLELPPEIWKKVPPGTKLRFIVDIHTIQLDREKRSWTLTLRDPVPVDNLSPRIHTPYGDCRNRYVAEFTPPESGECYLLVRDGLPNKIKFEYLKIEII
ncbi:MAG: hypothetical protein E7048_02510 [Lentisphaerae bacterium]|nr:hypothetical protein [Lentisphaerota bacterium]